jgi:mannose-1-phosphate guanylyltransferase
LSRWVVILAGGVGSRFWPLSTPSRPKQLLPLVSDKSLLLDTIERLKPLTKKNNVLVLTNASLAETVARESSLPPGDILAEPKPAGTAAALTWAASEIARRDSRDAIMICVHADWAIGDDKLFRDTLLAAEGAAKKNAALVTVGIVPTRPDPGFGYIQPGDKVSPGVFKVGRFIEKPDEKKAEAMIAKGALWNSGIFVWQAGVFLDEVCIHTPEVATAFSRFAGDRPDREKFFDAVKSISVDVGVLERSDKVLVVPGKFAWDDIGTWGALRRMGNADKQGNVLHGRVHSLDSRNNVVYAEGQTVVLYGVENAVVVAKNGITLVTTIDKSAHLKKLLDSLPPSIAGET